MEYPTLRIRLHDSLPTRRRDATRRLLLQAARNGCSRKHVGRKISLENISTTNLEITKEKQESGGEFAADHIKHGLIMDDGVWKCQNRIYVPSNLRHDVLIAYHFAPWGGHPQNNKMYKRVSLKYFWPSLKADCKDLTENCLTCARRT